MLTMSIDSTRLTLAYPIEIYGHSKHEYQKLFYASSFYLTTGNPANVCLVCIIS